MSDEEQDSKKDNARACAPAWIVTFADLMSLLMCFFVLLLSFSQMDVLKYKQVAGSMESAFGVQRIIEGSAIPKGTSIIAQEFSPGKPEPTVINEIRQITDDDTRESLRIDDMTAAADLIKEQLNQDAREIAELMVDEIKEGIVDVEVDEYKVIVRIRERGSFASGTAELNPAFYPVIEKIRMVLAEVDGMIEISGHTDDIPISTRRFRSNWELSAARAVSVTHALLETGEVDPLRFSVKGYGETRPLEPNTSQASRARNRRVEIIIHKTPKQLLEEATEQLKKENKLNNNKSE